MIKAVFYDMGDIFFEAHYWRKWMYDIFVDSGKFKGTFAKFYDLYEKFLVNVYNGKSTYIDSYKEFLTFLDVNDKENFIRVSFEQKKYFETNRILYKHVYFTLVKLKELGIYNIVLTDNESGEKELREKILNKFKINHLIDKIFSSKDLKLLKPDPGIYQIALKHINLLKNEVVFVGHDKDEIEGANSIGITTIEFNNYLNIKTNAVYKISDFNQIIDIIYNT